MRRVRVLAAALVAAAALGAAVGPQLAQAYPSSFMVGLSDSVWENSPTPDVWFDRTVSSGAQWILLPVNWAAIAPQRPSGDASNPANPGYYWGTLDRTIRDAVAHGLKVAFTVAGGGGAAWVDGPGKPSDVAPGVWKPNAAAFGAFAKAVAERYSGHFNPGTGTLPHVRYYEAWSEPNLSVHLAPQWVKSHGHWVAESPIIFRGLLNSFYAAVKSVSSSNVVISGGTAPFGDTPGGQRVPPALFVRTLLCIGGSNSKLTLLPCPHPAHFDILAHHPYSVGGPFWRALNPDDVALPDMWKLARPLALAERTGRVLPREHKQLWVTEFSWDSNPPNSDGVPLAKWARWMEESFYVLWRGGVDAIAWFELADGACVPNCGDVFESGLYFVNGTPKPGIEAFKFPFVVVPSGSRDVVWGIAPVAGTVQVQERKSGRWRTILTFRRGAHAIFTRTISLSGHPLMRARVGGQTSLTW